MEAWAPTREECLAEAARGLVGSFAVVAAARPRRIAERRFIAGSDADLLVAIIDEVIYRLAGIRAGMHWSVLVMVIMIGWLPGGQVLPETTPGQPAAAYWAVAVPCAIAFMAALLAHELAHSLAARRYGVPVTSITLRALGGVPELGGDLAAIVLSDGRITGIVTASRPRRIIRREDLRAPSAR